MFAPFVNGDREGPMDHSRLNIKGSRIHSFHESDSPNRANTNTNNAHVDISLIDEEGYTSESSPVVIIMKDKRFIFNVSPENTPFLIFSITYLKS